MNAHAALLLGILSFTSPLAGEVDAEAGRRVGRGVAPPASAVPTTPPKTLTLHAWFDLPADQPWAHGLSGLTWVPGAPCGDAVSDRTAALVTLCADDAVRTFRHQQSRAIQIPTGAAWDVEGVAQVADGWLLANEALPAVWHVNAKLVVDGEKPLPDAFKTARPNKALESISQSQDGACALAMSEVALEADGNAATVEAGTATRLVRFHHATGGQDTALYTTEPAPWGGAAQGVVDVLAFSCTQAWVLERGWEKTRGNVLRIFQVELSAPKPGAPLRIMRRTLVLDLTALPSQGLPPARQAQLNPLMANYESMALGPFLKDGSGTLILVADDNERKEQDARVLVLKYPR